MQLGTAAGTGLWVQRSRCSARSATQSSFTLCLNAPPDISSAAVSRAVPCAAVLTTDNSSLLLLNLRGNKLEGGASVVEDCGNLVQLDISQNSFTGRLPSSTDWDELATYRAANNKFSGRFPMNLTTARILEHLDISNNQLTGIIPHQVRGS